MKHALKTVTWLCLVSSLLFWSSLLTGCPASGGGKKKCEAGTTVSCACPSGSLGTAVCEDDGQAGDCLCDADVTTDANEADGGDSDLSDSNDEPEDAQEPQEVVEDTKPEDTGVDAGQDIAVEDTFDAGAEDTALDTFEPPDVVEPDVEEPPPFDCENIPEGPFELTKLEGPMASEDLDFDMEGNLLGSNDKAIFKSEYNQGPKVFVPEMKFRAGMRFLPSGQLVICDNEKGQLVRIDVDGNKFPFMVGLSYPNGLTVDMKGWVYFTEHDANKVWRVHPYTGEHTLITDKIGNPNGLTFSPDYKTLYIGGFNGGKTVYAMSISEDGVPGKLVSWAKVGTGWHDGMATDVCGNVYLADYQQTAIYRISPDGKESSVVIDGSKIQGAYLPNMKWGSGLGGWDSTKAYLPDGWNKGVFEVDLGVPGAKVPYP
jgi:hypothetical protein